MAGRHAKNVVEQLRTLFSGGTTAGLDDLQLLERFVSCRDEAAFEALIARHGPMVLGVCRRVLANPADVEDAFQATFLVLVKRAGSLRDPGLLSHWLYGVAYRVCLHARSEASRRPPPAPERVMKTPSENLEQRELNGVLDEEIRRLPERFRLPVVLCYLEGLSHEEAARRLRCPLGTVNSRLASARDRLRDRLTRRGLASADGMLGAVVLSRGAVVSPDVPEALTHSTVRAALQFIAGPAVATGTVPATAIALATQALHTMFLTKLKFVTAAVLVATIVTGWGVIAGQEANEKKTAPLAERKPASDPPQEKAAVQAADSDLRQTLRDAARAAISADDNRFKAGTLGEIAKEQVSAGDREAARVNFKAAAQTMLGAPLPSPDELYGPQYDPNQVALRDIAKSQAEAGFGADAIQTAQYLPTDLGNSQGGNGIQSLVLAAIADILANAGDFENAAKAVFTIVNPDVQHYKLLNISVQMVRAGDVKGALRAAERLTKPEHKATLLTGIASAQAQAGDPQGARSGPTSLTHR